MVVEKAKRMTLRKRILEFIPGYGHYKIEEELREWDRSVRDEAVKYLTECESSLNNLLKRAVDKRNRELIRSLEDSRKDIHLVKDRIKTQAYSYFPMMSPIKIDKKVLEKIIDIDDSIVQHSEKLYSSLKTYTENLLGEENFNNIEIKRSLQPLDQLLLERERLSRTGFSEV
ncbi:hypothetical protein JW865_02600 [Candidatus Bathyarchaeota archaeon]|nr:hypothetical protein [Candidatus Bathyarchaeota archaeon]